MYFRRLVHKMVFPGNEHTFGSPGQSDTNAVGEQVYMYLCNNLKKYQKYFLNKHLEKPFFWKIDHV